MQPDRPKWNDRLSAALNSSPSLVHGIVLPCCPYPGMATAQADKSHYELPSPPVPQVTKMVPVVSANCSFRRRAAPSKAGNWPLSWIQEPTTHTAFAFPGFSGYNQDYINSPTSEMQPPWNN